MWDLAAFNRQASGNRLDPFSKSATRTKQQIFAMSFDDGNYSIARKVNEKVRESRLGVGVKMDFRLLY